MEIAKADLITLGEYNQAIRKYAENWILYCDKYVMYGLDKDDCTKLSLYKYFISFVDLDSIKILNNGIFKNVRFIGKELSYAIKDRCEKIELDKNKLIMSKGKSDTKYTIGYKLDEKYMNNVYHLSDRYFDMVKSFNLNSPSRMLYKLSDEEIEDIKKYAHLKLQIGTDNTTPVMMYITIKLVPACSRFGDVNIMTTPLNDDKYNVVIESSSTVSRLGNSKFITLHRIINI